MSVKIMSLVWERAPYTAGSLIVLLALADWANDEGVAWPSMERLAQKARIDRRSAQRIVRQLEKDGVLEIEHGGGRAKQHRYVLKMETATLDPERATSDPQTATLDAETATPTSPDPSEEPSVIDPLDHPSVDPSETRSVNGRRLGQLTDDEFFNRLESNPVYAGIDIRQLNGRMIVWCELNGKRPTRRRLVNWLNRQDRPITTNGNGRQSNVASSLAAAERVAAKYGQRS